MLQIVIPSSERWDESREEFVYGKEQRIQLEHSLVSISKWESKWHKSFLSSRDKTAEEILDYVKCMTITQNVNDELYQCLTDENIIAIDKYIDNPMTATHFTNKSAENERKINRDIITSEIIYYWMIAFNIPFECQKWHLNKLLTLIQVCEIKNQSPKKRSKKEIMTENTRLNEERRKLLNTKG